MKTLKIDTKLLTDLTYIENVLDTCISTIKDVIVLSKTGECRLDKSKIDKNINLVNELNQSILDSVEL